MSRVSGKIYKTYIDGGYRAVLLVAQTAKMYHLAAVRQSKITVEKARKDEYTLTNIENQRAAANSFRRIIAVHGAVLPVMEAIGMSTPKKKLVGAAAGKSQGKKKKASSKKKSSKS